MNAAVIIPTWNNAALTVRCLRSLAEFTDNYHLIWIDNGSREVERGQVEEAIKRFGIFYKSYFNKTNLGFSKAINQGIHIAMAGDYDPIVLLNNDVFVTAGWLDKLRVALERYPKFGIIGSLHDKGTQDYRKFHRNLRLGQKKPDAAVNSLALSVIDYPACVSFSCTAIRRIVIENVGLLDEAFSPCLGEDNDYCDRTRAAGWKTGYCLNCFTWHIHRATVKLIPRYWVIKKNNTRYLEKKRAARRKARGKK
jgi:GT2 family glycosyltransferase